MRTVGVGAEKSAQADDELKKENEQLKTELETVKAENEQLKAELEASVKTGTRKTSTK